MCFDLDSRPPIAPIFGGATDARDLKLTSADGTKFMAYAARATNPSGAGMVVIPDVRGIHQYYKELALRFAESGVDAVAIDFFARTAPSDDRSDEFDFMSQVPLTKPETLQADIAAAAAYLKGTAGGAFAPSSPSGFCFGGALSYLQAASGLGYSGVIGFYGWPLGLKRWPDRPKPIDAVAAVQGAGAIPVRRRRRGHPPERRRGVRRRVQEGQRGARLHGVSRRAAQLLRSRASMDADKDSSPPRARPPSTAVPRLRLSARGTAGLGDGRSSRSSPASTVSAPRHARGSPLTPASSRASSRARAPSSPVRDSPGRLACPRATCRRRARPMSGGLALAARLAAAAAPLYCAGLIVRRAGPGPCSAGDRGPLPRARARHRDGHQADGPHGGWRDLRPRAAPSPPRRLARRRRDLRGGHRRPRAHVVAPLARSPTPAAEPWRRARRRRLVLAEAARAARLLRDRRGAGHAPVRRARVSPPLRRAGARRSAEAAGALVAVAQAGGAVARLGLGAASDRWLGGRRTPWLVLSSCWARSRSRPTRSRRCGRRSPRSRWRSWPASARTAGSACTSSPAPRRRPHRSGLLSGVAFGAIVLGLLVGAPLFGMVLVSRDSYGAAWAVFAALAAGSRS